MKTERDKIIACFGNLGFGFEVLELVRELIKWGSSQPSGYARARFWEPTAKTGCVRTCAKFLASITDYQAAKESVIADVITFTRFRGPRSSKTQEWRPLSPAALAHCCALYEEAEHWVMPRWGSVWCVHSLPPGDWGYGSLENLHWASTALVWPSCYRSENIQGQRFLFI